MPHCEPRFSDIGRFNRHNERRQVNALMRRLLVENPDIVAMIHGADHTNRAYWGEPELAVRRKMAWRGAVHAAEPGRSPYFRFAST